MPQQGVQGTSLRPSWCISYGTRENYLQNFNQSIDGLVASQWIVAADGTRLKAEEAAKPPF